MALSCCMFARAAYECHSPVVHCFPGITGFLRLWNNLTWGLVYILKQTWGASMLLLSSSGKQWGCVLLLFHPKQSFIHLHVFSACLELETSASAGDFSRSSLGRENLLFPMQFLAFGDKWSGHGYWQIHFRVCFSIANIFLPFSSPRDLLH